jgi:hypothetical protein
LSPAREGKEEEMRLTRSSLVRFSIIPPDLIIRVEEILSIFLDEKENNLYC